MFGAGFVFYVAEMEMKRTLGYRRFRTACPWFPAYAGMTRGVTPADAGVQVILHCVPLVSGVHRNDEFLRNDAFVRNDEVVRNDDTA